MGCDIRLHQEVKINGVWQHYGAPEIDRSYQLFGKMAGVRRDDEKPICLPRGIPDDITELTRFDLEQWNGDAHSCSWLDADQILQLAEWMATKGDRFEESSTFGYLFGNTWSGFAKYPDDRPAGLDDVRWVFWFDS